MTPPKALSTALAIAFLAGLPRIASAQQLQRTAQPSDQTFDNQTASYTLDLSQFLEVPGVSGQLVILETDLGAITFEMLANDAPLTVANFLSYTDETSYDNSIIHRAVPGFIMQGGGFTAAIPLGNVPSKAPVQNEFKLSNVRGTVAMAKLGNDPNSATNGWFVNTDDNRANLDVQNGGFTVFARVIGSGMPVVDTIMALPKIDVFGSIFDPQPHFPLERSPTSSITVDDLVTVQTVRRADLFPNANSTASFVRYTAISSSNSEIATATLDSINGNELSLSLAQATIGSSTISVTAEDPNGNAVELSFSITLEAAYVTLDSTSETVGYQASNYTLGVDSNTVWQAEQIPSWVTLSQTSGDGSEQITITVAQNEGTTPRAATFSINGQSHTLKQRSDFDSWLLTHFSANEIAAMTPDSYTADSDGDGLSNLVENTLQLDPRDQNSRIESRLDIDGTNHTLTCAPYSELVSYHLENSADLEVWGPLDIIPEFSANSVRFQIPTNNSPRAFYRLVIDSDLFIAPGN